MSRTRTLFAVFFVIATETGQARADDLTPGLETADLREKARGELRKLATAARPLPIGLYLAFDPSANDALAVAACDDDGDPVVVVSDAMLRLVDDVAHAASLDDLEGSSKVVEYAYFLGRSQHFGRRLLPPAPGFYEGLQPAAREDRLREMLSFVLARELSVHAHRDLECPHPTTTKESGDDVWTADEQRAAKRTAATIYPGQSERDADAARRVVSAGRTRAGASALLHFFEKLEAAGSWSPSYLSLHPASKKRIETIEKALP